MIACQQTTRPRTPRAGLALALLLAGTSCKPEKILCTTAHGTFSVRYTLVTGSGDCAKLTGGIVGVESYDRGGPEQAPNFKMQPVAIRTDEVGGLIDQYGAMVPPKMAASTGAFMVDHPDTNGFCPVGALTPVMLDLPAKPAMTDPMTMETSPALPAMQVGYKWNNVSFYVSPRLIGTQFTADLEYSKNGCTATYKVTGLYPSVGGEIVNTETGCDGKDHEIPTGMPDQATCSPCADPAAGRPTGSGISPDLDIICDPVVLKCLPKSPAPSLLPQSITCSSTPAAPAAPGPDGGAVVPPPGPMCLDAAPPSGDTAAGGDDGGAAGDTAPAGDTGSAADSASGG